MVVSFDLMVRMDFALVLLLLVSMLTLILQTDLMVVLLRKDSMALVSLCLMKKGWTV
jgi:hypothetical protein